MIEDKNKKYNPSILLGCTGFIILLFFITGFGLVAVLSQEREVARYPKAVSISSHSNYTGLPFEFRWDDSYLVQDNFTAVYNWYSTTFSLGAESQANGGCIQMDGQQEQFLIKRNVVVLVCQTEQGQRVYVSRTTAVNR